MGAKTFGYETAVWFKEAASYGEAVEMDGVGYLLYCHATINLEETISRIEVDHLTGSRSMDKRFTGLGLRSVQGTLSGSFVYGGNLSYLFNLALGKVTTSGSDPWEHKCQFNNYLYPGFSIAINKGGVTYIYDGCQSSSVKITATVGGPIEWSLDFVGALERIDDDGVGTPNNAAISPPAAPTMPTANKVAQCTHIDASTIAETATDLSSFEVTFTNELEQGDDKAYSYGSHARDMLVASGATCSVIIKRRHERDGANTDGSDWYDFFKANTEAAIVLTATHPSDSDYSLTVGLSSVYLTGESPKIADRGVTMEESPFVVYDLDDAATHITIEDAIATPATDAGAYKG